MKAGAHDRINVLNNPVNAVDPYGLSQEQVDQAYSWIQQNYPELTKFQSPILFDVSIPGDPVGAALPFEIILIDTDQINKEFGSQDWIVNFVAHELAHNYFGFIGNLSWMWASDDKLHDDIYRFAEEVRLEYLRQECH